VITLNEDWFLRAEAICLRCGGHCCDNIHPPISQYCYERLTRAGISPDSFEMNGYRRLKTRSNGECVFSRDGKCTIHAIKPETCRAGPFTFDVKGGTIEIYLKKEYLCPIVTLLLAVPEAYRQQYDRALGSITRLVSHLTEAEIDAICRIEEPETDKVAEIPRRGPSG
jgi:Fe-S-cluster containining protein